MEPVPDSWLGIEEDVEAQRKNADRQRLAWCGMGLVIVAALAGLLGSGPLSSARARAGALGVEYERFTRRLSPFRLRFEVDPGGADEVRLWLGPELLERLEIESVVPPPRAAELDGEGVTYAFGVASSDRPLKLSFHTRPCRAGRFTARVALAGAEQVEWTQLVYP